MPNFINKNCDICYTSSESSNLLAIEDGFPIVVCSNCKFVYVKKQPVAEEGKVVGEYYENANDENAVSEHNDDYADVNLFLAKKITQNSTIKGSFLDVGCGYGYLLSLMNNFGWDSYGTELSMLAVKIANKSIGAERVFYGDLSTINMPLEKFDVLNLTNVLEHVPSPTQTLLECKNLIANDGLIYIRVPNMEFLNFFDKVYKVFKLFGFKLKSYSIIAWTPPNHLSGFDKNSLKLILNKTGFKVIEIIPSKLGNLKFYSVVEIFAKIIFVLSLKRINISPTILAIAKKN